MVKIFLFVLLIGCVESMKSERHDCTMRSYLPLFCCQKLIACLAEPTATSFFMSFDYLYLSYITFIFIFLKFIIFKLIELFYLYHLYTIHLIRKKINIYI